ncbi:MAG: AMP-binding protein [Pseudomonadota bacterium]
MSQIAAKIKRNLANRKDESIVFYEQQTISARVFLKQINEFERELRSFKNNRCIAINLETSPTALACFIASLSVAKNTAYLDKSWPLTSLNSTIESIGADLSISEKETELVEPYISVHNGQTPSRFGNCSQTDTMFTCFTSGTTGAPKGCVRSEESWIASFEADQDFAKISPESEIVVLGSFSHSLGIYAAVRGLYANAKVRLFRKFDANKIAKQIRAASNAIIFGVPTQFVALARTAPKPNESTWRMLSTGAKLPQSHITTIRQKFPNADIVEFYGTSELSYVSARNVGALEVPTSVGTPLAGIEVVIQHSDKSNEDATAVGLVKVRSPLAFNGYIVDHKFTPAEEWISVGDIGFLGEEGALHLIGRIDRMFQLSGRNIVPEAIEAALLSIAGVTHAAVIGLPDPTRENRIVAIVEADGTLSRKSLVKKLKKDIASYTIPHRFYVCDEWPKTASGKTDFRRLNEKVLSSALDELP